MAQNNEELCRRVEKKAARLVDKSRGAADAASSELAHAQSSASSAEKSTIGGCEVATGCVALPVLGAIVGAVLELFACAFAGGARHYSSIGLDSMLGFVGLLLGLALFVYYVWSRSNRRTTKSDVDVKTDYDGLARRKLADAEELQRSVRTAAGRLRSATTDADRTLARAQLERLEALIDAKL